MRRLLAHVRGNAVGYLALAVSLGGTSYAATQLPADSVGSSQIKKDAVGSAEIRSGAVGAAEIRSGAVDDSKLKDKTIDLKKLSDKTVAELKADVAPAATAGATGPAGPKGDTGSAGTKGDRGDPGLPGSMIVARIRSTGSVTTTNNVQSLPLSGATWTQPAGEDEFMIGQIHTTTGFDFSSKCPVSGADELLELYLEEGGHDVAHFEIEGERYLGVTEPLPPEGSTINSPNRFFGGQLPTLFEPTTDTSHTLTAVVYDRCAASSTEHYTVDSLAIDVIGVR